VKNLMQPPNTALSGDASVRFAFVRRRVVVLGALVIIALIAGSLHSLWLSYRESLEATDRELANLAKALSEQTAWTWEAIDLLLRDTEQWYLTDGRGQSKELIDRVLGERAAGMRQVRTLIITDSDGIPRYRSDGKVIPGLDVSNRPYFVALRHGPSTGLFITEPLVTHNGRGNIVVLGRRLEDGHANFQGVVTATIDLQNLKNLYGAVKLGSGDAGQHSGRG
jgi:hypothetical protein